MYLSTFIRRAAIIQLPFLTQSRALTTMTLHNFTLDRSVFNKDLYTRINNAWFEDIPEHVTAAPQSAAKRWFGMGTPEEKVAFDKICSDTAQEALDSISPQKLTLPPFESHEVDEKNAALLSAPLLNEVKQAQEQGDKEGADTLLALVLLFDQMPRNLFRTKETLPLVYTHYDRLAIALLRSSMQLSPSPLNYSGYALRPVVKTWYFMPLIHSEQLSAHHLWYEKIKELENKLAQDGDEEALKSLKGSYTAEEQHIEPIRQFGRYPHRNECLGRVNAPEEETYLKTANTFGVKQGDKEAPKEEL